MTNTKAQQQRRKQRKDALRVSMPDNIEPPTKGMKIADNRKSHVSQTDLTVYNVGHEIVYR